jgi:isopenicillin-N epimerase
MSLRDASSLVPRLSGKINLNAGTLSPTPVPVQKRADELRDRMARDPSDFFWRTSGPVTSASRSALAGYLGCKADELLLLPNVTWAINLVVSSLTLPRGTEVLTTDHDYGSMLSTWQRWAGVRDWNVRTMTLPFPAESPEQVVAAFREAITPATRVLFLYHCTSPSGYVLPLEEICAIARERDVVTVVDGAHAPGMLPVNLEKIGADFYASNTHKWIMGPCSAGFLHVRRSRRLDLRPLITSWGWGYARSEAFEHVEAMGGSRWQYDLEFHGTADRVPQMVLPEALALRQALGGDAAIAARVGELRAYAEKVIPLPCRSSPDPRLRGALTIFEVPDCDAIAVRDRMYNEHHIECPITQAAGRQFLRVSTAWWNTEEELDALASAVRSVFA